MSKTLERTTFSTSRLLEFFTAKELQMQIGHDQKWWPIALTKELIDNALDACETANVTPEIRVMVEDNAVSVQDNGPGLPVETLERSLDYAVRVSDKTHYVSPSRGQLGNALKCVWAAPFVVDGEHGRVDVVTGGKEYRIDVSLDRIVQQPNLHVAVSPNGVVKTGTFVKMHWPEIASYLRLNNRESFYNPPMSAHFLAKLYAAFNPHATFSYIGHDVDFNAEATSPDWKKWKPSDPTSPHWYDVESLQALIAAYIAEEREGGQVKTVREFVSEFKGLSGTAKQKRVIEAALFSPGDYLHDMVSGGEVSRGMVELLLEAMQGEARPVSPATLGTIGEEHLADWLVQSFYASSDSVKYARKQGESGGLPYALEVAFAVNRSDFSGCSRDIVVGLNWAPAIKGPVFGSALPTLLSEAFVDYEDPVTVLVHLVCPKLRFTDRGKSTLELDDVITDDLGKCIRKVSKEWAAYKKRLKREARAQQREWEEAQRARQRRRYSIIDAAYEVMEGAYMKASAGGTLPANARQIMYAARPGVLRLTSGRKWKNSSYFTQMILPQYLEDFSDETADWDVVWDARGKLVEPHTAYRVDLGGIAVRRYIHNWRKCKLETSAVILDHQVETRGPEGRYSFALFVEKEGFNQLWEAVGLADKWDIAIMSTKGMSVTAARQLVDELSQKGVTILVLRDFDKAGFSIVHTLSTSGRRYQYKAKPKVIDLGLRSEDVKEMGLETEEVRYTSKKDPKQNLWASGATCAECDFLVQGGRPRHWYGERVELNAMASDQLVEWLERKLEAVGVQKVVPEPELLEKAYRRAKLIAEMQGAIDEVEKNFDTDAVEVPDDLHQKVKDMVKGTTDAWDDGIWKLAGGEVPS